MAANDERQLSAEREAFGSSQLAVPEGDGAVQPYASSVPAREGTRAFPLTGAEQFWYVLQCISFGAGYFAKIPTKKALSDVRLATMTDISQFWYVLQCIAFGGGYFAKVIHKKALSEMPQLPPSRVAVM